MNTHFLHGRSEREVTWYQRRGFLQAAASWSLLGSAGSALAQQSSHSIVERVGDVHLDKQRLESAQPIRSGSLIETGPGSTLTFVIGDSAFHVRQNSRLTVERSASSQAVVALRLLTGAIVSVWGKGTPRQIITPVVTAGIRGTGTYTEILPQEDGRTYFCNCYGVVDLVSGTQQRLSEAEYHQAFWAEPAAQKGQYLTPAKLLNHTDEEVEYLARLAGQRTAWQITGRKGTKDGDYY